MTAHFYQTLTPTSRIKYAAWRCLAGRVPIGLDLKIGPSFRLRPLPATDYGVAYDLFFKEVYQWPLERPRPVIQRIIDLGGNVGFSCLYWAAHFPDAAITVFEPHPEYARIMRGHLALNGLASAVSVIEAAAGTANGDAFLTDEGSSSSVVKSNGIPIKIVDVFDVLGAGQFDLLKIDIEGGEYPLLEDERFGQVAPDIVIVEWHGPRGGVEGGVWCERRLHDLGYETRIVDVHGPTGLIWGFKWR